MYAQNQAWNLCTTLGCLSLECRSYSQRLTITLNQKARRRTTQFENRRRDMTYCQSRLCCHFKSSIRSITLQFPRKNIKQIQSSNYPQKQRTPQTNSLLTNTSFRKYRCYIYGSRTNIRSRECPHMRKYQRRESECATKRHMFLGIKL